MPLYEYRCRDCGHVVEVLQKVNASPPRTCERCKGKLQKLISRSSFQLKGGGWFSQGYGGASSKSSTQKSPASEKSEKSEKSDKSDESDKSDKGKTESAPSKAAKGKDGD
jgi:putative FmdB family regulatory protein